MFRLRIFTRDLMSLQSVEEIAKDFGVTSQHIRTLLRRGQIPGEKIGNTWVISDADETHNKLKFILKQDVPDQKRLDVKKGDYTVLSFFSGAMGLDIGLSKAGFEPILASEIDPIARKTILLNRPGIGLIGDIQKYSTDDILEYAGLEKHDSVDLIVGGPPCQAFSTAGKRAGFNDERGNVFLTFLDRIFEIRPRYAVIENVRGLLSAPLNHRPHSQRGEGNLPLSADEKPGTALAHIINLFIENEYGISFNLYNSANYGSPQKRERIVMIASRDGSEAPYLTPTHSEHGEFGLPLWKTIRSVISDLAEEKQEYVKFPEKRLKYYRILKAGQNWKDLPECLRKEALGSSFNAGGGKTGFLRRLSWDEPSPTLVTNPAMPATDLAHPEKDRPLSIQEYLRIQEFPEDWIIFGSLEDRYRQIGNAVPISLGYAIGNHLKKMMVGEKIIEISGFKYSRYANTDHRSFIKMMKNQRSWGKSRQSTLF